MHSPVTPTLIASTAIDAIAVLALLFAVRPRSVNRTPIRQRVPIGLGRIALTAAIAGPLALVKALVLAGLAGRSLFYVIHLGYLFGVITVPLAGLAVLVFARGERSTPLAKTIAVLGLIPAGLGYYGTFVEPFRLVTETAAVQLRPARAGSTPLRVAVLADLQSHTVDEHLREAVRRAMAFDPHLILLPGDLLQCRGQEERERAIAAFSELLEPLSAPLGVWFVLGNCDWEPTVRRVFEGTEVRLLRDETARVSLGDRTVVIAGSDFSRRGQDFVRGLARDPGGQAGANGSHGHNGHIDEGDIVILVSHYPDAALWLPSNSRIDLTVAGHTHGGQINVPFFGPPLTLSEVPRQVAAGGLSSIAGNPIYVSRGIGCERGDAPRVRLNAPPEVSLITLE